MQTVTPTFEILDRTGIWTDKGLEPESRDEFRRALLLTVSTLAVKLNLGQAEDAQMLYQAHKKFSSLAAVFNA